MSSSSLLLFSPTTKVLHHHHLLLSKPILSRPNRKLLLLPPPMQASKNNSGRGGGGGGGKKDSADPPDRIISAACYLYPFLDGVQYGRYVLAQLPALQAPLAPLLPLVRLFKSFPFSSFLLFLALYFAVVRNPSGFSRYVRFNAMQAIVLDVLLIFPGLIERSFSPPGGVGLDLVMSMDSTVFLFLWVSLVYGSVTCLLGDVPRLPIVADAADRQVM
ncbi:uncharacterized protein M6B38_167805 [Iris pallida]|uniref:Protein TIC 20 n=1 Tax=Iris pallida TaxID=29817 RepID=A0AAX6EW11_IRIPA|nr:uncharacterized protein M6B38_167805 [Iris pallida]